jgi:hypothetical protein
MGEMVTDDEIHSIGQSQILSKKCTIAWRVSGEIMIRR